jgi:hypothetical protein
VQIRTNGQPARVGVSQSRPGRLEPLTTTALAYLGRCGLLVLLASIGFLCSACGGERSTSPTSAAADSNQQATTLERLLPGELGAVKLRSEAFPGSVWLEASPEEAFSPEVSVDISRFLERLHRPSSDLTVAWATAESGPKVVAYRLRGATARALINAYVGAIRERLSPGKLSVA